jgi:DNA-binding GntR family transcriptional regulator
LRDEVVSYVRELIVSGQARPGSWLPLDPLAEDLGLSATPVREALLLLAQDGWIIQEPNRGFRVAPVGREDFADAYLVHAFAAGELAARAAPHATPELLEELEALDAAIRYDPMSERAALLNQRLHDRINAAAESPRLVWFVQAASRFVPRRFWPTIPGWKELNEHAAILAALRAGDREQSRTVASEHIRAAGRLLLEHLEATGFFEEHLSGEDRRPRGRNARGTRPVSRPALDR